MWTDALSVSSMYFLAYQDPTDVVYFFFIPPIIYNVYSRLEGLVTWLLVYLELCKT